MLSLGRIVKLSTSYFWVHPVQFYFLRAVCSLGKKRGDFSREPLSLGLEEEMEAFRHLEEEVGGSSLFPSLSQGKIHTLSNVGPTGRVKKLSQQAGICTQYTHSRNIFCSQGRGTYSKYGSKVFKDFFKNSCLGNTLLPFLYPS